MDGLAMPPTALVNCAHKFSSGPSRKQNLVGHFRETNACQHNSEMAPLVLNLRMSSSCEEPEETANYEDALDSLEVMISQDGSDAYQCRDYLGRRANSINASQDSSISPDDMIDEACREKMVDWCYKLSDHFCISREICAFTFSVLDRFIDRCSCDRTAFKLAVMTSLYIATKMFNGKQLSVSSLAELSRGEFLAEHISQMERIILDALDYRMNPPTVQAFIQQLRPLYPTMDEHCATEVYKRAIFYSELCIFDYRFVPESQSSLAVACLLNAFQDVEGPIVAQHLTEEFLASLNSDLFADLHAGALEKIQARLWYLYSCSTQSQFDEIQPVHSSSEQSINKYDDDNTGECVYSPVSVVPQKKIGYNRAMEFSSL